MIETERLLLRTPEPNDVIAIYRFVSDAEVMRWLGSEPGTLADAEDRVQRYVHAWAVDGFGHFMVARKDTGTVVGRVGFLVWDEHWKYGTRAEIGESAEIELGWTLERSAWGNGFATEAARAARDWGLEHVQPRRLISLIARDNARSQRVAEKIGERYQHDVTIQGGHTVGLWELASPA